MPASASLTSDPWLPVVRSPVVGILGGMGPAATADFYAKLTSRTPAVSDQDHLRVIIWSDPTIPDRSRALTGEGPDPTPTLRRGAQGLRAAGASLLAVPCNTAHAFLPGIMDGLDIPVVDMIAAVAAYVTSRRSPRHSRNRWRRPLPTTPRRSRSRRRRPGGGEPSRSRRPRDSRRQVRTE